MSAMVPAWPVADMLMELYDAGWSREAVQAEDGPSTVQQWRIVGGMVTRVRRATAISVADLYESLELVPTMIPSVEIVGRIRRIHAGRLNTVMDDADRRAFYRAEESGVICERIADRLAVRYLGLPLELIQEVAA